MFSVVIHCSFCNSTTQAKLIWHILEMLTWPLKRWALTKCVCPASRGWFGHGASGPGGQTSVCGSDVHNWLNATLWKISTSSTRYHLGTHLSKKGRVVFLNVLHNFSCFSVSISVLYFAFYMVHFIMEFLYVVRSCEAVPLFFNI